MSGVPINPKVVQNMVTAYIENFFSSHVEAFAQAPSDERFKNLQNAARHLQHWYTLPPSKQVDLGQLLLPHPFMMWPAIFDQSIWPEVKPAPEVQDGV